MGSCYGLVPGMAEAADTIALSSQTTDKTITLDGTTVTVTGTHNEWKKALVTGGDGFPNVVLSGATIETGTLAASLSSGAVSNAALTIQGISNIQGDEIYGGKADSGEASRNRVNIYNGTVKLISSITGGLAQGGQASDNRVNICTGKGTAPEVTTQYIVGGLAIGGVATGNRVNISDGTVGASGAITGGESNSKVASDNSVNIYKGMGTAPTVTAGSIIGGHIGGHSDDSCAYGNSVLISDGTVTAGSNIIGGQSDDNPYESTGATGNSVTISGGTVKAGGNIIGGQAGGFYEQAEENKVYISGGTVTGTGTTTEIIGGTSAKGPAYGNGVTISQGTGTAPEVTVASIAGGCSGSDAAASSNTVTISQGKVTAAIIAGGKSDSGKASNNCVTISDGTVTSNNAITGGKSNSGTVGGNCVTISGGTIHGAIYGGVSGSGRVSGNIVNISGGTIVGAIYGGKTEGSNEIAMNNTINICGNATLDAQYGLFGSYQTPTISTLNTLNLGYSYDRTTATGTPSVWKGGTVYSLNNFSSVKFYAIPWSAGTAYLTATSISNVSSFDFSNLTFTGTPALGQSMTLLQRTTGESLSTSNVTLPAAMPSSTVTPYTNVTASLTGAFNIAADAVTYAYDTISGITYGNIGTVANGDVIYTPANSFAGVKFAADTVVNAANFAVDGLTYGDSITLLSKTGMTDTASFANVSLAGDTAGTGKIETTTDVSDTQNGLKMTAAATTTLAKTTDAITYTRGKAIINSIDAANTTWKTNGTAFATQNGYTFANGVTLDGSTVKFTSGTINAGDTMTLIDGTNMDQAGWNNLSLTNGTQTTALTNDTVNGVTLSGDQSYTYANDTTAKKVSATFGYKNITGITLGDMKWGTARNLTNETLTNLAAVNVSSLKFADGDVTWNKLGTSTDLVTSTNTGLDKVTPSQPTADYTVAAPATGVTATVSGTVTAGTNQLSYTLDTIKNLAYGDIGAVANGATIVTAPASGAAFATGTTVNTSGLKLSGLSYGDSINLLSANGMTDKSSFANVSLTNDGSTTAASVTKDLGTFTDTQNGLSMTGAESAAIAKDTTAKAITYTIDALKIDSIDAKNTTWKTNGTAFAAKSGYTFANGVTLDGSTVKFTSGTINAGDTMTLIDGTNMDQAGWNNLSLTNGTQTAALTNDTVNGVTLSGDQSYTYANDTTARKVSATFGYKNVTGITLGDMTWGTARNLTSETLTNLAAVDASGLKFADGDVTWNTLGSSTDLVTSTAGGLNNGTITQPTADYTVNPATGVSATVAGTVTAGTNKLSYALDTIKNLTYGDLGAVTNGATLVTAPASGAAFAANATVNTSGLKLSGLGYGGSINLLSAVGMSDPASFANVSLTNDGSTTAASVTKDLGTFTDTQNGLSMTGAESATIAKDTTAKAITYTIDALKIDSIDAKNTTWKTNGTAFAAKSGYTFANGVTLDGAKIKFTSGTANAGDKMTLIDGTNMDQAGWNNLSLTNEKQTVALANDTVNGVTLSGNQSYTYANDATARKVSATFRCKNITGITLGDMTWGTERTLTSETLTNLAAVDASGLKFADGDVTWNKLGSSTDLVTSTNTGLDKVTPSQPTTDYTVAAPATGVSATVAGTVTAGTNKLSYALDTIKNLTYGDLGAVANGATIVTAPATGAAFAANATVNTSGLKLSGLTYGDSITLLSANGMTDKSSFANVSLAGDTAGTGKLETTTDVSDTQNDLKMTAAATATIAKTTDAITYTQGKAIISGIDASSVTWNTNGTAFATQSGYTFANGVTLDGATIQFTSGTINAGDTMTLIDGTNMDQAGWNNLSLTNGTQTTALTNDTVNGVTLSGNQSYTYANDTTARKVSATFGYKNITGITLGDMNWGTTRDLTNETLTNLAAVDASGLKFADGDVTWNKLGTSTDLVTSTAGGLNNGTITQPTADYTVTPVTGVSATVSGTVTAGTNQLSYALDTIKNLTYGDIGAVTNGATIVTAPASGAAFAANSTVNTSGLKLSGLSYGDSINLLSTAGMSDKTSFANVSLAGDTAGTGKLETTTDVSDTQSGLKMTAAATATIAKTTDAITYTQGNAIISGIDASSVTWNTNGTAFATQNGYTFANGVTLDGATIQFTSGTINAGDTMTLIDGTNMDQAGWNNLSLTNGTQTTALTNDTVNGVTLSGNQSYTYANDTTARKVSATFGYKNITGITLGDMTWGTERTLTNETLTNLAAVDASGLKFADGDVTWDTLGTSTDLVTSTNSGLNNGTITQPTADYTVAPATGVTATVSGTVTASDKKLSYALDTVRNLTYGNIGAVTNGATIVTAPASGAAFAANSTVNTSGLKLSGLSYGDSINLLSTAGMSDKTSFANISLAGDTAGTGKLETTTDVSDTQNGLKMTAAATTTIAKTTDAITYTQGNAIISGIDASSVTWNTNGTAFATQNGYTFANGVTLDGATIQFTSGTINAGDTMTLIDGTNMDQAGWNNLSLTNGTQTTALTNDTVNGVTLSGDQSYTYANDTTARKVSATFGYKNITGITLGTMNWGTARNLTNETLTNLAAVDASGLKFADGDVTWNTLGTSTNLVTSTAGGLNHGTITQPTADYTVTPAKGVSATVAGTVTAGTNQLSYALDTIQNLTYGDLGAVTNGATIVTAPASGAAFATGTTVNTIGLKLSGLSYGDSINLLSAAGMTDKTSFANVSLAGDTAGTGKLETTTDVSDTQNGLKMTAAATTTIAKTTDAITYTQGNAIISGIDASSVTWNTNGTAFATQSGYTFANGVTLDGATIQFTSGTINAGDTMTLIDGTNMDQAGWNNLSLTNGTQTTALANDTVNGVTLSGDQSYTYANDTTARKVSATFGYKNITGITLGTMTWGTGRALTSENLTNLKTVDASNLKFADGDVTWDKLGTTTNLLTSVKGGLSGAEYTQPTATYTVTPITGVSGLTAELAGTVAATNNNSLDYTLDTVKKLTFGSGLTWATGSTLLDLSNNKLNLANTAVDTTNIGFTTDSLKTATMTDGSCQMTLLKTNSASGLSAANLSHSESTFNIGDILTGTGDASYSNGNVVYTIQGSKVSGTEQTHHAVVGASAGSAATTSGSVNNIEMAGMALAGITQAAPIGDIVTFSSIGGGSNTYETGSSVTTRLWQVSMGAGARHKVRGTDTFEYALYYEGGRGNYTTYNEHATNQYGSGKLRYNGGGIFMRYELPSRFYAETSVHTGRMTNEASNVLYDSTGKGCGYKTSSGYYGWHVGIGKIYQFRGNRTLDVYGKYFFNKNNAVSYDLNTAHFDIDAVSSKQMRLGFRMNQQVGAWKLYYGGAFDYEFDGKATGTVSTGGLSGAIRASSTKGGSGMLELGYKLEATDTNPWELDLNLRGFVGKHRGETANIGLKYMFN